MYTLFVADYTLFWLLSNGSVGSGLCSGVCRAFSSILERPLMLKPQLSWGERGPRCEEKITLGERFIPRREKTRLFRAEMNHASCSKFSVPATITSTVDGTV